MKKNRKRPAKIRARQCNQGTGNSGPKAPYAACVAKSMNKPGKRPSMMMNNMRTPMTKSNDQCGRFAVAASGLGSAKTKIWIILR